MGKVENGEIDYKMITKPKPTDWETTVNLEYTTQTEVVTLARGQNIASVIGERNFHYKRVKGATTVPVVSRASEGKLIFKPMWIYKKGAYPPPMEESVKETPPEVMPPLR